MLANALYFVHKNKKKRRNNCNKNESQNYFAANKVISIFANRTSGNDRNKTDTTPRPATLPKLQSGNEIRIC